MIGKNAAKNATGLAKNRAKTLVQKTGLFVFGRSNELSAKDVEVARKYIKVYWSKLERTHAKDDESLLGLPKPYLVPASEEGHEFDFNEMYYWDSYFMVQGLYDQEHKELVLG